MKKRILCLFLVLILLPVSLAVSADSQETIYGAQLWVNVPVGGLELCGKQAVEISTAYTGTDTRLAYPDPMDHVFKTDSVTWYDLQNPDTALKEGTKAQLGKTYKVSVRMAVRDGFTLHSGANQHPGTQVNGETPDSFAIHTDASGKQYLLYEKNFTAIAKSDVLPEVEIQQMNLTPYEGNPMEVSVRVSGGTNVRYQWQLVYGNSSQGSGGLDFNIVINLADNHIYQGSRTANFKLHSYFGDTADEDTSFKIRCRVTTDNGVAYSQPVWYTLQERQVVSEEIHITGLATPMTGRIPDQTASISSEKCQITKVEWFCGDELMGAGEAFQTGQYRCRIHIATADAYKFGNAAEIFLNGTPAELTTIPGKDQVVRCADTYYVERVFDAVPSEEIPGDLTSDGSVDNLDVEHLLWHTLFPESYPITQTADYNHDGSTDNLDVEYLLWHTLFPEDYPLTK